MTSWPRAVLFDFDGVIVNSEPIHYATLSTTLNEAGLTLDQADYYGRFLGVSDRDTFRQLLAQAGRGEDPQLCQRLVDRKSELVMARIEAGDVRVLPGVEPLVRRLAARCVLGICSGALRREIEAILAVAGMRGLFATVVTSDEVAVGKPDPSGYLLTTRRLSDQLAGAPLVPADCLVVEDSPAVVTAMRVAGFRVLAVANGHPRDQFRDADWIVPALSIDAVATAVPRLG